MVEDNDVTLVLLDGLDPLPTPTWRRSNTNSASLELVTEAGSLPAAIPTVTISDDGGVRELDDSDVDEALTARFEVLECAAGPEAAALIAASSTPYYLEARTPREPALARSAATDTPSEAVAATQAVVTSGAGATDLRVIVREGTDATFIWPHGHNTSSTDPVLAVDPAATASENPAPTPSCSTGRRMRLVAERDAHVKLILTNTSEDAAPSFESIDLLAEQNAHIEVIQATLGRASSTSGLSAGLVGDDARLTVRSAYLASGTQHVDVSYVVHHLGARTECHLDTHGAAFDEAEKTYKGTIDFKRGCVQSIGAEREAVLLFSDRVSNISTPVILCEEEDVEGSHAAQIGHVEEDVLFYLQSRGLSVLQAQQVLVEAGFSPILDAIGDTDTRQAVQSTLTARLRQGIDRRNHA